MESNKGISDKPRRLDVDLADFRHQIAEYKSQEVIFWEGDPATNFYIILDGKVQILRTKPDGGHILIATLGQGEFFGEMALLQDSPRTGSAIAYFKTKLLVLSENQLAMLIAADAWFGLKMIKVLSERLKRMGDTLVQI